MVSLNNANYENLRSSCLFCDHGKLWMIEFIDKINCVAILQLVDESFSKVMRVEWKICVFIMSSHSFIWIMY